MSGGLIAETVAAVRELLARHEREICVREMGRTGADEIEIARAFPGVVAGDAAAVEDRLNVALKIEHVRKSIKALDRRRRTIESL